MRPVDLPESTSETVDCETPAARATSTLVTRGSPRLMARSLAALAAVRDQDLVEETVVLAGRELAILRPRSSDALIDEHAFEHEEYLPYWAELWPSALALADALGTAGGDGRRVLELGCGLGVPSLVAALRGADVLATDWSPAAVEVLRENARRAGAR